MRGRMAASVRRRRLQPRDVRGRYARVPRKAAPWWSVVLFFGVLALLVIAAL